MSVPGTFPEQESEAFRVPDLYVRNEERELDEGLFVVFGDPESGKTWLALAAVVSALQAGALCAVVDLDHNGPEGRVRLCDKA